MGLGYFREVAKRKNGVILRPESCIVLNWLPVTATGVHLGITAGVLLGITAGRRGKGLGVIRNSKSTPLDLRIIFEYMGIKWEATGPWQRFFG